MARPLGPTRYVPAGPFAVLIAVPAEAAAVDAVDEEAGGAAAAACELELLELPHPATTIVVIASAARPPALAFAALRLAIT
jgi:hypothetical protein